MSWWQSVLCLTIAWLASAVIQLAVNKVYLHWSNNRFYAEARKGWAERQAAWERAHEVQRLFDTTKKERQQDGTQQEKPNS